MYFELYKPLNSVFHGSKMNDSIISINKKDHYDLHLSHMGSSGFTIQWSISNEDIANVEHVENPIHADLKPGDSIASQYRVHFKKKGKVRIEFYESRIWEENGLKNTLEVILFIVE